MYKYINKYTIERVSKNKGSWEESFFKFCCLEIFLNNRDWKKKYVGSKFNENLDVANLGKFSCFLKQDIYFLLSIRLPLQEKDSLCTLSRPLYNIRVDQSEIDFFCLSIN